MKNLILMVVAVILTATSGKAQNNMSESRSDFLLGWKLGANYSNVYDTKGEAFNADPKLGLATGIFADLPIGKLLGIHPEILFSQKGFKATGQILGGSYDLTRTTNYIDIPLLFALKPAPFLTLLAGPQFSYLLKQTDVFANATTSIAQEQEFKNEDVRKNTMCFLGGADINISHYVVSARAGWDVQNNIGNGTSTTPRYKNVWYQLTLGYRF